MNILHLNDFGGISSVLAQQQRARGHETTILRAEGLGPIRWNERLLRHTVQLQEADILHVHGGMRRSHLALRPWKGKIVTHFHGSDARLGVAKHHLSWASATVVSTPDLLPYIPQATWIPNPLHIPLPPEYRWSDENGPVHIGHFPTNPAIKGTALIQEAVAGLPGVTLSVFHNLSHEKALGAMKGCDLVIDQVNDIGTYGLVTLEAWALGKPVICSLRRNLYPYEVPLQEAEPEVGSIQGAITYLVQNRWSWRASADLGREFLHEHHDPARVTEAIEKVYAEVVA